MFERDQQIHDENLKTQVRPEAKSGDKTESRRHAIQDFDEETLQAAEAEALNRASTLYEVGMRFFEQGKDKEALQYFLSALEYIKVEGQLLFTVYKAIGNSFVRLQDFDAAEEYYNKAFAMDPDSDVLLVNYGTLEIQRNALNKAVERFRQAVQLNPMNDRAWVGLGMAHRQFGDLDLAWANIERALDINPKNESALHLLVDWGARDSRFSLTIETIQRVLQTGAEQNELRFCLAKLLFLGGRLDQSIQTTQEILSFDPHFPGAAEFYKAVQDEYRERQVNERS